MAKCYISVRDVQAYQYKDGVKLIVATDIPCHLYMRWSYKPPWSHSTAVLRRGLLMHADKYFCFTVYHDNEQEEAGDTLTHTFIKTPWVYCECRYFYFWGKVGDTVCESDTPCFQLHMNCLPAPPEAGLGSTDCQMEHNGSLGFCQYWNANSQTFSPDHDYLATGLSLLLTQHRLDRKGPLIVKIERPAANCWEASVIWSCAFESTDLPPPGDFRWTSFLLPNLLLRKGLVYRITVHTTPGWSSWQGGQWVEAEAQVSLLWRCQTSGNPYPRGMAYGACNYQAGSGSWSGYSNYDYTFCLDFIETEQYQKIDRGSVQGSDDCYTYGLTMRLDYDYLYLDYATLAMHAYMRFPNITIPPGATIVKASIDLCCQTGIAAASNLRILGIKELDTATFEFQLEADARPVTDALVNWNAGTWAPDQWYGGTNDPQDIKDILQEIIDQPGWSSGNALAIKIINTALLVTRICYSLEGVHSPHLHIEYTT